MNSFDFKEVSMKSFTNGILVFFLIVGLSMADAQTVEDYIKKGDSLQKSGDLAGAVKIMEEAIRKFPNSAKVHSYLGLYLGMQAGKTQNYMEAGRLVSESYKMLDKAVAFDPKDPLPRFHRGLMGVSIPEFLGKLDLGVSDLETFVKISKESPDKVEKDWLISGYDFLSKGYQKKKDKGKAMKALERIIELAPTSLLAEKAKTSLIKLKQATPLQPKKRSDSAELVKLTQKLKDKPDDLGLLLDLGKAYMEEKDFEGARKVLTKVTKLDPKNISAYKLLIATIGELAEKGYDERIYHDTDLRTNLAFDATRTIDKACEVAPDDIELRLMRGTMGVQMPFFVGKLEQAIEDLNWILKSKAPDSTKAEALYWLGMAHRKKAMTYWIKVVSKYSKTQASQYVFDSIKPSVKRLNISKLQKPILIIDFVLGFQDELPPQTAVWVERKSGEFIKTIYVSGFSGFAKEQQVNLPVWSKSSKFFDVDAVTRASIDIGHHIYIWDLKDHSGKVVPAGEYIIRVEAAFWPSMEYQAVAATIKVSQDQKQVVMKEGNLIPFLEVKYIPKK
jgi:tetratricopeptide (TPR) repeat protein